MVTEKMQALIQRGQVTRMHEVSADGIQWQKAEEFSELYPRQVAAPAEKAAAQATPTAEVVNATAVEQPQWYAHIDDQRQGPFDEAALHQRIASGKIVADTLVWKNGMPEWVAAEVLLPNQFPQQTVVAQQSPETAASAESTVAGHLTAELGRRQGWIYVLSIVSLVLCVLNLIAIVFALVTQLAAPAASGGVAIVGFLFTLLGLGLTVVAFIAFLNLLQYANSLNVLKYAPTDENAVAALKKLSKFWFLAGIWVLSMVVICSVFVLLAYAFGLRVAYLFGN